MRGEKNSLSRSVFMWGLGAAFVLGLSACVSELDEPIGGVTLAHHGGPGYNGDPTHCSAAFPCAAGGGDCDSDAECAGGAVCPPVWGGAPNGQKFGLGTAASPSVDVCVPAACFNGIMDGAESGVDCGSASSCGQCSPGGAIVAQRRWGTAGRQRGYDIARDRDSNMFITGMFDGTLNLGGADMVSAGGTDIFVAKFTPTGVLEWSSRFGGTGDDYGVGIGVSNNVGAGAFVTGMFQGTMTPTGCAEVVSSGGFDAYVMAVNGATGQCIWVNRAGDAGNQYGADCAPSATQVSCVGYYRGVVNWGGGDLPSGGEDDRAYVTTLSNGGVYAWANGFGTNNARTRFTGVAVDSTGRVIATGFFSGTVNFGGVDRVSAGGQDGVLMIRNSAGVYANDLVFGNGSADQMRQPAVDSRDNIFAVGQYSGPNANLGCGVLATTDASPDHFLVQYTSALACSGVKVMGGSYGQYGHAVAVDGENRVVFGGACTGATNLGGPDFGCGDRTQNSLLMDAQIGKHQPHPEVPLYVAGWGKVLTETAGRQDITGLAVSLTTDEVWAIGWMEASVDPGLGLLTSAGLDDILMLRYSP